MDYHSLISVASFIPLHLESPNDWDGHLSFASWLIKQLNPKIFVELGKPPGNSYFSFCQTVKEEKLQTECFTVSGWQSEQHAEFDADKAYSQADAYNRQHYADFSRLLPMTFDEASEYFLKGTVGLLHINGAVVYEAIKHDFEMWLPKVAPGAVMIFHSVNERERNFGTWKLWKELQSNYPLHIEFTHSHGRLGVVQLGNDSTGKCLPWLIVGSSEQIILKKYFAALDSRKAQRFDLPETKKIEAKREIKIGKMNSLLSEQDGGTVDLNESLEAARRVTGELYQKNERLQNIVARRDERIADLDQSLIRREARISELEGVLDYHKNTISELEAFRNSMINAYSELESSRNSMISAYESTRTWRLTQPMRSAANITRRILGKQPQINSNNAANTPDTANEAKLESAEPDLSDVLSEDPSPVFENNVQEVMRYLVESVSEISCIEGQFENYCVTVVVPVYRGVFETERCLQSVLNSTNLVKFRLLIINDYSPEPEMDEMLRRMEGENVEVFKNSENLGFVKTVNEGMRYAGDSDVILLNSDTIVANNWIDRLINQAFSEENIGTVTPFSNNATICSYPNLDGWALLPADENLSEIDLAFTAANFGKNVEIPTAVGFCMFIKRYCLKEVGLFDEDAFGKGYGEENDFCLKAREKGWKHVLATDTFVFHEGEVSFSREALDKKAAAMNVIRQRYPTYESEISEHITQNLTYRYRVAATAARYRLAATPTVMFITHNLGGGTERHVQELSQFLTENGANILILRPGIEDKKAVLDSFNVKDGLKLSLDTGDLRLLAKTLNSFGIEKIHIHQVIGFNFSIEELLSLMEISYDYTAHDYLSICPRVHLLKPDNEYCGIPNPTGCNACLSAAASQAEGNSDIYWWRLRYGSLLNGAERVFCPSQDVVNRLEKFFPLANTICVPHEQMKPVGDALAYKKRKRRFAILGMLSDHKGLLIVEKLLKEITANQLPIEIILIGYTTRSINASEEFFQTGVYLEKDLQRLIKAQDPDAILFLPSAPETYSYTLSSAIQSGKPIVAPRFGAFPERLQVNSEAFLFSPEITEPDLANYLASLDFPVTLLTEGKVIDSVEPEINRFYESERYWTGKSEETEHPTLLVIPEMSGLIPSPCSYIRLIQPLMSEEIVKRYKLRVTELKRIHNTQADAVVVNRLPCSTIPELDDFLEKAKNSGAKLIYDIDDNLLDLHHNHPEKNYYDDKRAIVLKLLNEADCVWTSTDELADRLRSFCKEIIVIENYLNRDLLEIKKAERPSDHKFRILYMGTSSYRSDLASALGVLKRLMEEGLDLELNLIGVSNTIFEEDWIKTLTPPSYASNYPNFMRWLKKLDYFDLGIAPLENSVFNQCKSDIKFWDYTAMGIPVLASDVGAYSLIIKDGKNGLLADNSEDAWRTKINWAAANRGRLKGLVINAVEDLINLAVERSNETKRRSSLSKIVGAKGKKE